MGYHSYSQGTRIKGSPLELGPYRPYGSKDPNNGALGPICYDIHVFGPLKPYYLGP